MHRDGGVGGLRDLRPDTQQRGGQACPHGGPGPGPANAFHTKPGAGRECHGGGEAETTPTVAIVSPFLIDGTEQT